MTDHRPQGITLAEFSSAFVVFGVLLVAALIWPEGTGALNLNRTKATIWATAVLLNVALIVYPFRSVSPALNNLAALFWTFAGLAFLTHAYWAVFIIFDGVIDTFRQMGLVIAGINFLLTIAWSLDVVLLWMMKRDLRWLDIAHAAIRIFAFIVFAATLVILRGGSARVLGIVFTSTVIVAVMVRVLARARATDTLRPAS
jgi:hypothetical protein